MKTNNDKGLDEEFDLVKGKLQKLTVEQLLALAKKLGIVFSDDAFADKKDLSAKEQIILTLDEADPTELNRALSDLC